MTYQFLLAGRVIEVDSIDDITYHQCRNYLCRNRKPDISITVTEADLRTKQLYDGGIVPPHSLEPLAIYRKIAEAMPDFDTILMHGSVVSHRGEAFMFTAPSGVGKSTRTRMWMERYPDSYIVNGDKPLVVIGSNRAYACGTPWCGKEHENRNTFEPLKAILLLERADTTRITELSLSEALNVLIRQTYRPDDPEKFLKTLALIRRMGDMVKFYRYESSLDDDTIQQLHAVLYGEDE